MNLIDQREDHYEKFLGKIEDQIMHSTDDKVVHVDIYTFSPTDARPFYTLITGGMSDMPQFVPHDWNIAPRAEIMLYTEKPQGWMYNVLKGLAEMPFDDQTFLSYNHTVPNGKPMTAQHSLLTSYFFTHPILEKDGFTPFLVEDDFADILLMIPITEAERELAVSQGAETLVELFAEKDFDPVINEHRACLVS